MHIGFDISQTGSNKAGCGYFSHAIVKAMLEISPEYKYSLFPSFGDFYFDMRMPVRNPYRGREVHYGPKHLSRESSRIFWNRSNIEMLLGRPDIIHSNNFWCPIQYLSCRLIYTFYDMGFTVNPEWTTETNRVGCFEGVFRSAMVADWIVAISKASKDHYLKVFPHFPEERIRVIYPCSRFLNSTTIGKRPKALDGQQIENFWLNVGTMEPRKNQRSLIKAYAQYLTVGGKPYPLVLTGGKGWLMGDFNRYLNELGIADHVIMTGYVSDSELIWLYKNCYANLYPSLFEGFGLPVLEGMQFGAPTVASNTSSLPEVVDDAAILLDPKNIDAWMHTMLQLSRCPEKCLKMRIASKKQSKKFSWKESALSMLELYKEAYETPKRSEMLAN